MQTDRYSIDFFFNIDTGAAYWMRTKAEQMTLLMSKCHDNATLMTADLKEYEPSFYIGFSSHGKLYKMNCPYSSGTVAPRR